MKKTREILKIPLALPSVYHHHCSVSGQRTVLPLLSLREETPSSSPSLRDDGRLFHSWDAASLCFKAVPMSLFLLGVLTFFFQIICSSLVLRRGFFKLEKKNKTLFSFFFLCFSVCLYGPGGPGTHSDEAGLELRDRPVPPLPDSKSST